MCIQLLDIYREIKQICAARQAVKYSIGWWMELLIYFLYDVDCTTNWKLASWIDQFQWSTLIRKTFEHTCLCEWRYWREGSSCIVSYCSSMRHRWPAKIEATIYSAIPRGLQPTASTSFLPCAGHIFRWPLNPRRSNCVLFIGQKEAGLQAL